MSALSEHSYSIISAPSFHWTRLDRHTEQNKQF